MNPEIIKKIEEYLNDEMLPLERKEFEQQLSTDEELRNDLELYNTINKTMTVSTNENELRETLQHLNKKYFDKGTVVRKVFFKKWMAVAASLTIIIVAGLYFLMQTKPPAEKLYAEYAQHAPLYIQLRGITTYPFAENGATEFNNKNYRNALPLFETYLAQQPDDIQIKFAAAICYLETGKYGEAEKIFSAIANGQTAYADAATWYQALTALKQKDFAKCRSNLNSITQTSAYFIKAKELLDKLPD